ncbi:enoyl-CoA hydratase/isomerase family protein [Streptomyces sp. NPDC007088]|uniref:enoyl-CoA hydratase/isomerase family protein n=1 Tax=Streptomyces sp. NPDC007088 TaxID=3364773 RepID=UPI003693D409
MEPEVRCVRDGALVSVVLSNPAKRNAMTPDMWRALPPLLDRLAADPGVRVLVLRGEGATFCAGADIASLAAGAPAQDLSVRAEEALAAFPRPTLAAVRGHCVGGGCQLAAACDLRFAHEDAVFGVTPARLGIVYPASSTRRLASLAGAATAKYLLYSAALIDAERALRTGLVDELLPADRFEPEVAAFATLLTERSALTQSAAKEFLAGADAPDERGRAREAYWTEQARLSGETAEGAAAFLERRAPGFRWKPGAGGVPLGR